MALLIYLMMRREGATFHGKTSRFIAGASEVGLAAWQEGGGTAGPTASVVSLAVILGMAQLLPQDFATARPRTEPCFAVRRSTILAFFPPVKGTDHPDSDEALSDFRFYAAQVREPLLKMGIDFREVYAPSFCVSNGANSFSFRPSREKVGYAFIRPGMKARIEYGVETDGEIEQRARDYFAIAAK